MSRPEYLSVRLIVWEGKLGNQRAQVKAYTAQLQESINESVKHTKWKYSRWKTYPAETAGHHKLEVYIRHPILLEDHERSNAIHGLCGMLLRSDLATRLRLENPTVPFTFCPSKEGGVSMIDNLFARCFSSAVVTQYCVDGTQSEEMERLKGDFLNRNSTKFIHIPMVATYNLASIAELYERHILQILDHMECQNGSGAMAGDFSKLRSKAAKSREELGGRPDTSREKASFSSNGKQRLTGEQVLKQVIASVGALADEKGGTTADQMLRLAIANSVTLSRAFVGYAPEIKEKMRPMLQMLNDVAIRGRLRLASQAYMLTSRAPIAALEHLQAKDNATTDEIATTINSFGSLMQSTLPLFDATLAISDAEFANIAGLSVAGATGLGGLCAGGAWLWYAGASAGPVGLMFAGGATALAFGAAAWKDGWKWGQKQKTDPPSVLLSIQKTIEECCLFLLALSFMIVDEDEKQDTTHLEKIQQLREKLSNKQDFAKPGYMRAYYRSVSKKLAVDMGDLATGLARLGVEVVVAGAG